MYYISSFIEYILMEVSQNIPIYTYSVTLAYNGIFTGELGAALEGVSQCG